MTPTTRVSRVDPGSFEWAASAGVAEEVRRTVAAATTADRASPLDEAALLSLRHSGLASTALWVAYHSDDEAADSSDEGRDERLAGRVAGFALADALADSPPDEPRRAPSRSSVEVEVNLVVAPALRGRGVGRTLAGAVLAAFPPATISAWSHGNHPAAAALAPRLGFERVRDLWLMRRSLAEPLPQVDAGTEVELGAGLDGGAGRRVAASPVVRSFEPGRDEQAFLELNAAAFAHHPEQGGMTRADLDLRMREDWFDPAGFFLATSADGRLLGFHWTKVHEGDPSYGEVYVVGVSPDAQGMGLGRVLTLTGLHHLRSLGLGEVVLYVESDNEAAVAVYRRLGFTHADPDTHVMYRGNR